jgi:hypothetical protein
MDTLFPTTTTPEKDSMTTTKKPLTTKRPTGQNLFALLPDMIPEFRKLTIGGQPVFDQNGNVIPAKRGRAERR